MKHLTQNKRKSDVNPLGLAFLYLLGLSVIFLQLRSIL